MWFSHRGFINDFFFVSTPCRTPHDSKHLSRGGAEGKRSWYDFGLGGSSRTIQSAGRIIKPRGRRYPIRHMMIPFAGVKHLPSLLHVHGVGGSLGERIDKGQ